MDVRVLCKILKSNTINSVDPLEPKGYDPAWGHGGVMRALWKGSITFGLVNIPVKMYVASKDKEFKFVMLHKKDFSKIRYARMCVTEEKEVPWNEIIKAYEYEPGEFVAISDEDFEKANLQRTKSIEIVDFVKEEEVDSIYYTKPYFLEPEKNAANAYALLRDAMVKSKKVGIARYVLHNREHVAVIKPFENALVLNELHYESEILGYDELNIPKGKKPTTQELSIALKLIDHLTTKFKPGKYKDTYTAEIRDIIKKKAKGRKIHPKTVEKKPSGKIHDIMSLLKASLKEDKKKKPAARKRKVS